jgi:hypothetical protein
MPATGRPPDGREPVSGIDAPSQTLCGAKTRSRPKKLRISRIWHPWRPGRKREAWELRRLLDGSEHRVFKRYLTADELARELEAVVVLASVEFAAVRTPL